MAAPQKEYGLITRKKPTPILAASAPVRRLAAFASDSDDDSDSGPMRPTGGAPKVNVGLGELQQRQILKAQEAALTADPTIFQYDELYDDLQEKREVQKVKKPEDKKPKYIERLLKSADTRKKEYERRIERQVQKEREAEGDEFRDKESFVTSSYRAKLEEMRKAEAAEKRDEYLETIGDVTKQRDLGGFYRHMFEQRLGGGEVDGGEKQMEIKKERTYRKRKNSEADQSDDDVEKGGEVSTTKDSTAGDGAAAAKKAHLQSNLDADSDFSIDSSDSESEDASKTTAPATLPKGDAEDSHVFAMPLPVVTTGDGLATTNTPVGPSPKPASSADEPEKKAEEPSVVVPKVKVNIWLKRTVGDVLLGAIQRYYERKVAREAQ